MDWHLQFKELHVDPALQQTLLAKLDKLRELVPGVATHKALLVRHKSHIRNKDESIVATITLVFGGSTVRSEGRSHAILEAFDVALAKCKRQLSRYKGKHEQKSGERLPIAQENELSILGEIHQLKRRKQLDVETMTLAEAIERMELLDHDFYAFLDAESKKINVVYRREDGDYGTLEINPS